MSGLHLTRVVDDANLQRYQRILAASFANDFDRLPADPVEDIRPALSGSLNGEPIELWTAEVEDRPVAAAWMRYPDRDNRDLVKFDVHVHPGDRGHGYGRAALEAVIAKARESGRTKLLGEVATHTKDLDPAPGIALGRSLGARPMLTEIRRLLDLSQVTDSHLQALADAAAQAAGDYSTLVWQSNTPEHLYEDMAGLMALMSTDPPQGDLDLEPEVWNADRYREWERSVIERGRQRLVVAARDDRTGRLVGFTDLASPAGAAAIGYQWATIVRRDHRGHRLGMLMKAVNLHQLRIMLPHVQFLNTWNADENTHMVSVNETLGYRKMEGWSEWQVDL